MRRMPLANASTTANRSVGNYVSIGPAASRRTNSGAAEPGRQTRRTGQAQKENTTSKTLVTGRPAASVPGRKRHSRASRRSAASNFPSPVGGRSVTSRTIPLLSTVSSTVTVVPRKEVGACGGSSSIRGEGERPAVPSPPPLPGPVPEPSPVPVPEPLPPPVPEPVPGPTPVPTPAPAPETATPIGLAAAATRTGSRGSVSVAAGTTGGITGGS